MAAQANEALLLVFPQGHGRARVYLCAGGAPQRFAGPGGVERFLRTAATSAMPGAEVLARARPAGPCRTYPGGDAWADRPFAPGAVLVGDAGGHNDPLIGQGLSLALRDARELRDRLLQDDGWSTALLEDDGRERAHRLRRTRFVARLEAEVSARFGSERRRVRAEVNQRLAEVPELAAPLTSQLTGPDTLPDEACTEAFRRRYLGLAS